MSLEIKEKKKTVGNECSSQWFSLRHLLELIFGKEWGSFSSDHLSRPYNQQVFHFQAELIADTQAWGSL